MLKARLNVDVGLILELSVFYVACVMRKCHLLLLDK